jgi:hypothetical protein
MFIVELEKGVWSANWIGDPGRTVVEDNAQVFHTVTSAKLAIKKARKYRKFKNARVIPLNNTQQTHSVICGNYPIICNFQVGHSGKYCSYKERCSHKHRNA